MSSHMGPSEPIGTHTSPPPFPSSPPRTYQKKISFGHIQKALLKKSRESQSGAVVKDMLDSLENTVALFQKRFIWSPSPESLQLLGELLHEIESIHVNEEAADQQIIKVSQILQQTFVKMKPRAVLVGEGRVKAAYVPYQKQITKPDLAGHVYLVAKGGKGILGRIVTVFHKTQIKEEFRKIERIKKAAGSFKNLALEFAETAFEGVYSLQTKEASFNLEEYSRKASFSFQDRLKYGFQFLCGLRELHAAGYVHGDLKPANILVYPMDQTEANIKISDFGSARRMDSGEKGILLGNPRFTPPEGRLSHKGEIYSAALILIRILEEAILENGGFVNLEANKKKTESKESEALRGIEKFLVQNKNCPQTEKKGILGPVRWLLCAIGRVIMAPRQINLTNAERETNKYVDDLIVKLKQKFPTFNEKGFDSLQVFLKRMLRSGVDKRPNAIEASDSMGEILKSFWPSQAS